MARTVWPFYFTLPSVVAYVKGETRESSARDMAREPVRILVVEDGPAAAHLLQSHLASAGYDVVVCNQPQRALEMAAELQPSAVTLDILMEHSNLALRRGLGKQQFISVGSTILITS